MSLLENNNNGKNLFCLQRIMDSAEQAAAESESDPEQQSQKSHSSFYDARKINVYDSDGKLAEGSKHMLLRHMRRFEALPVNVSLSSLLFPSGVEIDGKMNTYFLNISCNKIIEHFSEPEVRSAIRWSSHLDPLFANNLERDPALSWQYFGSSTGFLRRFPGTAWPPEGMKFL